MYNCKEKNKLNNINLFKGDSFERKEVNRRSKEEKDMGI